MKSLKISIKTISPVLIPVNTGDTNMVETAEFIPGTTILGLFANKYLKTKHADEKFHNLFSRGKIIFSNAYIKDCDSQNYPLPGCLQKEKNNEQIIHNIFKNKPKDQTKSIGSFGRVIDSKITKAEVEKIIHFHHVRDAKTKTTETTEKGGIFNYTAIKEGQIFSAEIFGNGDDLESIKSVFTNREKIHLGRSKTAQYGECEISFSEITDFKPLVDDSDKDDEEVIMTLLSDTIIYNANGYSVVDITALADALGIETDQIENSSIKKGWQENFVGIWKAKKSSENFFAAGNCFLLKKLPERYQDLEKYGIGEKTNEGFGRVSFGYPELGDEYGFDNKGSNKKEKPKYQMPELTKQIIINTLNKKLQDKVISRAYEDADKFKNHPLQNHLCGRLQGFSEGDFFTNISNLRNTALDKIKNCHNGKKTLSEFLNRNDLTSILNAVEREINMIDGIEANSGIDALCKLYLRHFFIRMRKNNSKKEVGNANK